MTERKHGSTKRPDQRTGQILRLAESFRGSLLTSNIALGVAGFALAGGLAADTAFATPSSPQTLQDNKSGYSYQIDSETSARLSGEGLCTGKESGNAQFNMMMAAETDPGPEIEIPGGPVNFKETGYAIDGDFKDYWYLNGQLARQGFPISPVMDEKSEIDGKMYKVQYFERAKMEIHPENNAENRVLLELFGVLEYKNSYPKEKFPNGAPNQAADTTPGAIRFNETGKTLGPICKL